MKQKIFALALCAMLFALCDSAEAQQKKKVHRIGLLSAGSGRSAGIEAFRRGLYELGYIEGKSITIENRFGEGNYPRLSDLAAELVRLQVDVIFVESTLAARPLKEATKTIPIVVYSGDPVGAGLVASLARPGGNITGVTTLSPDLNTKRLELVRETFSGLALVAILWDPDGPVPVRAFKEMQAAARVLGVKILSLEIRSPDPDLDGVFQIASKKRAGALIAVGNPLTNRYRKRIVELAIKNRLPSMFPNSLWTDQGGLMAYGILEDDLYRRAATYVDKILKGAKPADLPVEQPTKFELVINLKTAKQIGLTIPPEVLYRADKIIK